MRAKVIELLSLGYPAIVVANATGLSESRISQIASEPAAAEEISAARFSALQKHNTLDNRYDELESKLLDKLEQSLCFIQRPGEIVKSLQVINAAKRKGVAAPETATTMHQRIVNVILPSPILPQFTVNAANQVIQAGEQTLLTMASQKVGELLNDKSQTSRQPAGSRITGTTLKSIEASSL